MLLVGLLTAVLVVRDNRLAALEASAALADFRNDFRAARIAELDAPGAASARLEKVEAACMKAVNHFRVLDDPAWSDAAAFRRLSSTEQDEARADVGE